MLLCEELKALQELEQVEKGETTLTQEGARILLQLVNNYILLKTRVGELATDIHEQIEKL